MHIIIILNQQNNKISGKCFHQTSGVQLSVPLILQYDFPNHLHFHLLAMYDITFSIRILQ